MQMQVSFRVHNADEALKEGIVNCSARRPLEGGFVAAMIDFFVSLSSTMMFISQVLQL